MKRLKKVGSVGLLIVVLFSGTMITLSLEAAAETKVVAIEGVSYNVNFTLQGLCGFRIPIA